MIKKLRLVLLLVLAISLSMEPLLYAVSRELVASAASYAFADLQEVSAAAVPAPVTKLALASSSIKSNFGSTVTVRLTLTPFNPNDLEVRYTSSSLAIQSITADPARGVLTITAAVIGQAKEESFVQFTSRTNRKLTKTAKVTIQPTPVSSVSLYPTSIRLKVGETFQLEPTVLPAFASDKSIKWATSKKALATVSASGLVTAIKPGTVTITTTSNSGKKKAVCTVTVEGIPVTSLQLGQSSQYLKYSAKTKLSATVLPANATNKTVTWTTSNSAIATVDKNGQVTAKKKEGSVTITAKADGILSSCVINVNASGAEVVAQPAVVTQASVVSKSYVEDFENEVITRLNKEREQRGLSKLVKDPSLVDSARVRAKELVQLYEHVRPDGSKWSTSIKMQSNVKYGEIIYKMVATPANAVEGWMLSDSHRRGILTADFAYVGVGCYQDAEGNLYWCTQFSSKKKA